MTVTRPVALKGGAPLSVATTVKTLVPGPSVSPVDHVIELLPGGLSRRPAGVPAPRVKVSVWPGSGSLAGSVSERVWPSSIVMFVEDRITGGELVKLTVVWASGRAGGDCRLPALSVARL